MNCTSIQTPSKSYTPIYTQRSSSSSATSKNILPACTTPWIKLICFKCPCLSVLFHSNRVPCMHIQISGTVHIFYIVFNPLNHVMPTVMWVMYIFCNLDWGIKLICQACRNGFKGLIIQHTLPFQAQMWHKWSCDSYVQYICSVTEYMWGCTCYHRSVSIKLKKISIYQEW